MAFWRLATWPNGRKHMRSIITLYNHASDFRSAFVTSAKPSTMSPWNSSSFLTPQNREKMQIAKHKVRSSIKIHHYLWLVYKNSIVWPRDLADEPASLVFEVIETFIWKLPIVPVVRIVSKFFKWLGRLYGNHIIRQSQQRNTRLCHHKAPVL